MPLICTSPDLAGLAEAMAAMRTWPRDREPVPLHPGDVGWNFRFGADATAAAVRVWRHDGSVVAVGMLDSPGLLRLAIAPDTQDDEDLARRLLVDLSDAGVLPAGSAAVELRAGAALRRQLLGAGWVDDEPWTPLVRDLAAPVEDPGVRIEVAGPRFLTERVAVQRSAFERSTFTVDAWQAMAAGPAYSDARCLVAFDDHDAAVAVVTVWSAGPGRPGLLEPLGVHRDHRGQGHGRAIARAAAAALRELGSSSAFVCTPSENVGGVATYVAAGFTELPEVSDLRRPARPVVAQDSPPRAPATDA